MPWFKIDDQMPFHQKVMMAGNEAVGAWARMGAWASANLTDGMVSNEAIDLITGRRRTHILKQLMMAKLLDLNDGGYRIHDFLDYNPSRESVLAKRKKDADRKRGALDDDEDSEPPSARNPKKAPRGVTAEGSADSACPDPTRPVPTPLAPPKPPSGEASAPAMDSGEMPPDPPQLTIGRTLTEFQSYWAERTGILTPNPYDLKEAHGRIALFAATAGMDGRVAQERALDALERIVGSWSDSTHKGLTPQRLLSKWDEIQPIVLGKVKPPAPRAGNPMAIGERPASYKP